MEYRKKHLKPKQDIEATLERALNDETFMYRLDFVPAFRKSIFMNQNEKGIKAVKPTCITSEGFTVYLNQTLRQFI